MGKSGAYEQSRKRRKLGSKVPSAEAFCHANAVRASATTGCIAYEVEAVALQDLDVEAAAAQAESAAKQAAKEVAGLAADESRLLSRVLEAWPRLFKTVLRMALQFRLEGARRGAASRCKRSPSSSAAL